MYFICSSNKSQIRFSKLANMTSVNNVERLMQELSIEQLAQIQSSLKQEMENKREELRQMVGRRYRDVLEASNTVKRLTEIAGELASLLADIRGEAIVQRSDALSSKSKGPTGRNATSIAGRNANRRFMLFHSLLPLTFTSDDLLSRTYCLCLAESLQRALSSGHYLLGDDDNDKECTSSGKSASSIVLQLFSDQLLQSRVELLDILAARLGDNALWNVVASNLVAYALLKPNTTTQELLQFYLQSRMNSVVTNLRKTDSTLHDLIRSMKETVQCAEQIFGSGEALLSSFQCFESKGWSPEACEQLLETQPLAVRRLLLAEIARINAIYLANKVILPGRQEVQQLCFDWVVKMCEVAGERVRLMCAHFEHVDQAIEFAVAVSQIFKSDWSGAFTSSSLIYHQLFDTALLDRFCDLIDKELRQLEQQLRTKILQINCEPHPLFHKRAAKFDSLLASGVSPELDELVRHLSASLLDLNHNVTKYTQIGQEENVEQLHDVLADQVIAFVDRLTDFATWNLSSIFSTELALPTPSSPSSADENRRHRWLALFRLLLALVQHEPSVLCQCMNRNVQKIVRCNQTLHNATEQALWSNFMEIVIDDFARTSNINAVMQACCSSWEGWLDLLQEPEHVQLSETATIAVPTQLSQHLFIFLSNIYREINQHSLGHLFTRTVSLHVSRRIGSLLSQLTLQCAEQCASIPQICSQLLLDSKALFLMFPDKDFINAAQMLETKLDPIELSVLQEPLSRNAKLISQRTVMLFGQLQAELNTVAKDAQLLPSYAQLVDITPKGVDVQRLAQISRLSKLTEETQKTVVDGKQLKKQRQTKEATPAEAELGIPAKGITSASLSSLYDKISTGWFKS